MKEEHLKKLAVIGLTTGLLISPHKPLIAKEALSIINQNLTLLADASSEKTDSKKESGQVDKETNELIEKSEAQNLNYHKVTEDELYGLVNTKTWQLYQSLDPVGKALALKIASQTCNNQNDCKHQNACQTASNPCAGKGDCKAKSKCNMSDKNIAVKIAAQVMEERRKGLLPKPSDEK